MTEVIHLTQFATAKPVPGELMKLYLFGKDGMHNGRIYFRKQPKSFEGDREGELDIREAAMAALVAVGEGREIRVTNGGDELLFRITTGPHGEVCESYPQGEGVLSFFASL